MSVELLANGDLKIEEYEFGDFLREFQEAVQEGYVLDLQSNDRYPQKYGSYLSVTLVSTNYQPLTEADAESQVVAPAEFEAQLTEALESVVQTLAEEPVVLTSEEIPLVASLEQATELLTEPAPETQVTRKSRKSSST